VEKNPATLEPLYEDLIVPFGGHTSIDNPCSIIEASIKSYDIKVLMKLHEIIPIIEPFFISPVLLGKAILLGKSQFNLDLEAMPSICWSRLCVDVCIEVFKYRSDVDIVRELRRLYEDSVVITAAAFAGVWTPIYLFIKEGNKSLITNQVLLILFSEDHLNLIKNIHDAGVPFNHLNTLMHEACRDGITASAIWLAITFGIEYDRSHRIILNENHKEEVLELLKENTCAWELLADHNNIVRFKEYLHELPFIKDHAMYTVSVCDVEILKFLHGEGIKFTEDAISSAVIMEDKEKILALVEMGYEINERVLTRISYRMNILKWGLDIGILKKEALIPFIYKCGYSNIPLGKILYERK
jgi:hypothetical protein